jgi:hypothetical protein
MEGWKALEETKLERCKGEPRNHGVRGWHEKGQRPVTLEDGLARARRDFAGLSKCRARCSPRANPHDARAQRPVTRMSTTPTSTTIACDVRRAPLSEEQSMRTAIAPPNTDDELRDVIRTWIYPADAIAAMTGRTDADVRAQMDECVIDLNQSKTATFDEMVARGYSRGRLYRLQVERGLRLNEAKIRQRRHQRELQAEFLRACENETVTGEALDVLAGLPDDSVRRRDFKPPYNVAKAYESASDAMRCGRCATARGRVRSSTNASACSNPAASSHSSSAVHAIVRARSSRSIRC